MTEEGVEKTEVGAGSRVGLGGGGHHELQLFAVDGLQDIGDGHRVADEVEFLGEAFFDAEYNGTGEDRLRVFDPVVLVAESDPKAAGGPDGIYICRIGLELEHDVDRAFVGEFDIIALLFGKFFYEGLEGFVLGAGEEAEGLAPGAGGEQEDGEADQAEDGDGTFSAEPVDEAEGGAVCSDGSQRIAFA
jgi:hypothetical protein